MVQVLPERLAIRSATEPEVAVRSLLGSVTTSANCWVWLAAAHWVPLCYRPGSGWWWPRRYTGARRGPTWRSKRSKLLLMAPCAATQDETLYGRSAHIEICEKLQEFLQRPPFPQAMRNARGCH